MRELVEQLAAPEAGLVAQLGGDLGRDDLACPSLSRQEGEHLHLHQVDHAAEGLAQVRRAAAHGQVDRHSGLQSSRVRISSSVPKKSAPSRSILLMKAMPRHVVLVGLPPDGLALGLDALPGAEDHHAAVEHPQAPLDLGGEIDVAGRVDQVDVVDVRVQGKVTQAAWMVMPRSCSSGS